LLRGRSNHLAARRQLDRYAPKPIMGSAESDSGAEKDPRELGWLLTLAGRSVADGIQRLVEKRRGLGERNGDAWEPPVAHDVGGDGKIGDRHEVPMAFTRQGG
jgi:hypothetical protein